MKQTSKHNAMPPIEQFTPHVTVATVVERAGLFLMVEEASKGNIVFNQPAGHLEENESLTAAATRETLEETGWEVKVTNLIGIHIYRSPSNGITYLRTTFVAKPIQQKQSQLDHGIIAAHWLSEKEIRNKRTQLRSPLVLQVIEQYLSGIRHPLTILNQPLLNTAQ